MLTNKEKEKIEDWEVEFEKHFDRRHTQMTHLNDKIGKKNCEVCIEDREKNPKGYYRTFLHEQKCYWNREMYDDVVSFIKSLLHSHIAEIKEKCCDKCKINL